MPHKLKVRSGGAQIADLKNIPRNVPVDMYFYANGRHVKTIQAEPGANLRKLAQDHGTQDGYSAVTFVPRKPNPHSYEFDLAAA